MLYWPFVSCRAQPHHVHLRLLETTDVHLHLMPYDYYADTPSDVVGLSRTAGLIDNARLEMGDAAGNVLLFDNGDFLQGNPMGDRVAGECRPAAVHPAILAMNALGYDAAALGNHEFNYGLDFLDRARADALFPMLCANLFHTGAEREETAHAFRPWTLLDRRVRDISGQYHDLRIGVIGFLPPQVTAWDRRNLHGRMISTEIVDAAMEEVPKLRAAGADLVVALCHSGIGGADAVPQMEQAAVPLAAVPGIDAVMTGHTHQIFPSAEFHGMPGVDVARGTLSGKPAVMAGVWGSHLGVMDLALEHGAGGWRVIDHHCAARPIYHRPVGKFPQPLVAGQAALENALDAEHRATLDYIRRPVGLTQQPLHTYFAQIGPSLALQLVADAQRVYVAQALACTDWANLPLLSAIAPLKGGGRGGPDFYTDVAVGGMSMRSIADLYQYPNTISAVCITGALLRGWLERAAGQFQTIVPGMADQPLLDRAFPSYNFDVIYGADYRIDLSAPSRYAANGALMDRWACRITALKVAGRPVRDHDRVIVATNTFRADGGGGSFPAELRTASVIESRETVGSIVQDHVRRTGPVRLSAEMPWRFASMPGTTVLFDTGPGAVHHPEDADRLGLEMLGPRPDGYVRFRLRL
ncbi:MAG: bifunctional 2',3'-cyclic-nucleotide 2'-phosphodiesterase/3'-nucleotidase [Paracoccaceae bacterium]